MWECEKSICFCCGWSLKLFVLLKYFCNSYWKQSNHLSATHFFFLQFFLRIEIICPSPTFVFVSATWNYLFATHICICFCKLKLFVRHPLLYLFLRIEIICPSPTFAFVSATWNYLSAVHFPQMCPLLILHSEAAKPLTNLVFRCTTVLESQSTPPHQ